MNFLPQRELLTTQELKRLIGIFRGLGVNKIRLTGGEPLLRPDLSEILNHITRLGIPDVSITTNGVLLASQLSALRSAGLTRINISLDSFQPERFEQITGADCLPKVLESIHAAVDIGLRPVKINMVVMRGWNLDEVPDFVRFAVENPVEVRFLELMPTRNTFEGRSLVTQESFVSVDEIRSEVERRVSLGGEDPIRGVARSYPILGGQGRIGFVSPVSSHFCGTCNRVRLTSLGGLKTCLHGEDAVNLKSLVRRGASDAELAEEIRSALFRKPEEHFIRPDRFVSPHLQMSQVGG